MAVIAMAGEKCWHCGGRAATVVDGTPVCVVCPHKRWSAELHAQDAAALERIRGMARLAELHEAQRNSF